MSNTTYSCRIAFVIINKKEEELVMKKEVSIFERPEKLAGYETGQYLAYCGNLSWYDLVTSMLLYIYRRVCLFNNKFVVYK